MKDTNTKRFKKFIVLHKRYFETGLGITNYVKYLIALFGLASLDILMTLLLGVSYAIVSYFLGRIWVNRGFLELDQEISNRFNLFVKEMRRNYKKKKR